MEISSQEIVNLSDICRVCLVKTENMRNLLDADEEIIELITKLASIANLEIEINESLPSFLCHDCEEKLKISYGFQQLVQKSHHFILACLSATDSFKVNGTLKPLKPEELSHIDQSSEGFINFVNDENLEAEIKVTCYNYEVDDISLDEDCSHITNENQSITETDCNQTDDIVTIVSQTKEFKQNDNIVKNDLEEFIKPKEIEKKTKTNQTMRLAQYSIEDINKLIKKTRERCFKSANCLHCGFTSKYSRSLSVHMTRLHKELKKQWCLWCNQNFDDIKEHHKIAHRDDYKCPLCGKYSTNTGHFLEHLASHSTERKHICKLCKKCFISARHLKMHYAVHTQARTPYNCSECSTGFISMKAFKNHLRTHRNHKCRICKKNFDSIRDFNIHKCIRNEETLKENDSILNIDDANPDIILETQKFCSICNKNVRSLKNHKEKYHSETNGEKRLGALCAYCGKQFRSVAKLTVHARIHTGETPYKCSYCDKRTTTRFHLVVHERTHTGEKPHVCNVCGKAFAQSSVLNTHMKLHTGRPEQCSICLKRFCRSSQLRQHMREHTGEKPYLCSICGQGFKQTSHLVEHSKTHSNERPYQCEFCEKSFKQAGTLKSHINIHLEKKPYKCSQCPYACRQSYSLTQHMAQHDNDQPKPDKPHSCGICDRNFSTLAMFSSHYISKHAPQGDDSPQIITDNLVEVAKVQDDKIIDEFEQFTQ